jgi:hypothetical protein
VGGGKATVALQDGGQRYSTKRGGLIVDGNISRKEFFQRCVLMGFAVAGGGAIMAGCGGGGGESESGGATGESATETASAADPCGDTSGLTEMDLTMRENLKYVAESEYPDKNCLNCKFYLADQHGEQCGGCQLFKGPVHPEGYCTSWFAMEEG